MNKSYVSTRRLRTIFKVIFNILALAFGTASDAYCEQRTVKERTEAALREIDSIDSYGKYIYESGIERFQNFNRVYLFPNTRPGFYVDMRLPEYFGWINAAGAGPEITFEEANRLATAILNFGRPEQYGIIAINDVPKQHSLFRRYMFYTIGLQRALDRLEQTDIQHQAEISIIKKRLSKLMSHYLVQFQESMLNEPWEVVYLYLIQAYYTEFDGEVVEVLTRELSRILTNRESEKPALRAANNLLIEVSLLCFAKCTAPSFKFTSSTTLGLDNYINQIAYRCLRDCKSGIGLNPYSSGFYRKYLTFLQSTNDPNYDSIRSEIVWEVFSAQLNGAVSSLTSAIEEFSWAYLKQGAGAGFYAFAVLISLIFHYAPLYYAFFAIAFIALVFFGRSGFSPSPRNLVRITPLRRKSFTSLAHNAMILPLWLAQNLKQIFLTFIRNLWGTFGNESEAIYKIASSLLLVAVTLALSELYSIIERSI